MRRYKIFILLLIICAVFAPTVNATDEELSDSKKNIEIVQLQLLENGEGLLSVYYCYPLEDNASKIETQDLISENFTFSISELTFYGKERYATISCSIPYTNIADLQKKVQGIKDVVDTPHRNTLFNFYVLLDNIVSNLNFQTVKENEVSLTIDTSSFINQKYYMTNLDNLLQEYLQGADTTVLRDVDTIFYLITPNQIEISNAEQFAVRQLNSVYTEYSCQLNNQKLHVTLMRRVDIPQQDIPEPISKLEIFLNSKWYYLCVVGCSSFIVISIIIMIVIAKSYNKVIEIEEKRAIEERTTHSKDDPMLYWSKEQREQARKKKNLMQNPNALVRDSEIESSTESIENSQYKRQNTFRK